MISKLRIIWKQTVCVCVRVRVCVRPLVRRGVWNCLGLLNRRARLRFTDRHGARISCFVHTRIHVYVDPTIDSLCLRCVWN